MEEINVVHQRRIVKSKVRTELELEFRIGRECVVFVFTAVTVGGGASGFVCVFGGCMVKFLHRCDKRNEGGIPKALAGMKVKRNHVSVWW